MKRRLLLLGLMLAGIGMADGGPAPVAAAPPGPRAAPRASANCPALAAPAGTIVHVATVAALEQAVNTLQSNTTILIADGDYPLDHTLVIGGGVQHVALRGASGNRDAVVIRGQGMANPNYGNVPHGVLVQTASDLLLADLTIRDAYYHDVQIQGEQNAQRPRLYNLHLLDSGEQFVKVSTGPGGPYADNGEVACSLIEYTDRARSDYTNGVDALGVSGWVVRDNVFRNIRAPAGALAGPTVLLWRNSLDSVVERNQFVECDRAVALGLSPPDGNSRGGETTYDHQGGIVRNNFIYRAAGALTGDVGITVNYARDFKIDNNTVILNGTFPWAIEYRFAPSSGAVQYNLADGPIQPRDGATATLAGNVTSAQPGWFADAAVGDLHLLPGATQAIDHAASLADVPDDFDGTQRPVGAAPDIGADEYAPSGQCLPAFDDVHPADYFYTPVGYLYCHGAVSGYADNSFRPYATTTRAQLAKIVVLAQGWPLDTSGGPHFRDVPASHPFYAYVETAYHHGTIAGYADGTFGWGAAVTRAQLSKIMVAARQWTLDTSGGPHFADVPPADPFYAVVETAYHHGIVSGYGDGSFRPGASATRGQICKIVYAALGGP